MWLSTLVNFVSYASLVPFLLGLFSFSLNSKPIRYLIGLSAVACITEFTGTYLALHNTPNLFLFHFYPPIELCLLLVIYSLNMRHAVPSSVFWSVGILFILFSVINTLYFQPLHVFNTYGRGTESFLVLGLAIGYSILHLGQTTGDRNQNRPMFWINTGVLIYFSVNLVFFFMSNFLLENLSQTFNYFVWGFHALVSLALYLFFTFAIYLDWKKAKSPVLS